MGVGVLRWPPMSKATRTSEKWPLRPSRQRRLDAMIEALPLQKIEDADIESLTLQLILDTPDDDPKGAYATRAKLKLECLRLLKDIRKDKADTGHDQDLLQLLRRSPDGEA